MGDAGTGVAPFGAKLSGASGYAEFGPSVVAVDDRGEDHRELGQY